MGLTMSSQLLRIESRLAMRASGPTFSRIMGREASLAAHRLEAI